ncbi:hypothetical protein AWW72_10135 [Acinetobacter sp. NRRL B-65365]|uniref:hypothetical protein n=1 Tax=Acinetobacter sp. NRRL B-65365 TaxID=1785092 RepID=UPI0007A04BF4|nr:hypothetical protein [Acinetobacter sp. NRRL B-65365]KYQ84251.1 hypothetical protein AWW72_10135 [Acinetobacter sp. NRRL B-65365]
MSKLVILEEEIKNLDSGKEMWIGNDFDLNEMQSVIHLIKVLQNNGEIRIVDEHSESITGNHLIDIVRIQKL